MSEQLSNNVDTLADGSSADPKENIDLAWDMAHAEKPFQDAAIEAQVKAREELELADNGMSSDLSLKVADNRSYDKENGRSSDYSTGASEWQVVSDAQYDQKKAIENGLGYLDEDKRLKELAEKASKDQLAIYAMIKQLEKDIEAS